MRNFLLLTICLLLSIYTSAQTAPVANPDIQTTNEDTPVTFSITINDTDPNGDIAVSTVDLDTLTAGIQNTFAVSGQGLYQVGAMGDLTFTPVANYNGAATPVSYTVNDLLGNTSNTSTISITVTAVNDIPSFVKGQNQSVCENSPAQTVNNWATAISAGPANESSQTLSFTITNNDKPSLFSVQPAVDATGNLTYTPALNQSGSAIISVHINDNGGIANGGVDKSEDQTFSITINALPTIFNVTGGGSYCSGGSGVAIGLSGSQTGVNYQLYLGVIAVDSPVPGTGSAISFGLQTTAGTNYNVIAMNTSTTCTQNMSGSATVTVNALPTIFNVTGGGSYCSGGSGVAIGLSGSQIGINYQLYSGASAVGPSIPGTGSAISFGLQTTAGANYNVIATNISTSCTQNMNGSATVTVNALPTIFNVTGGGSYCSGGSGVAIGLSGSQAGVNYQLYSGASAVGPSIPGTGSAISFGLQTTAGTNYNVIATNTSTSCTQNMSGSATISIDSSPVPTFITSPGSIVCALTDVTYRTQNGGGITNYIWTVSGTLGVDYTISSGGIGTSSNSVTLKWLTSGNKTVTVNYNNSSGCPGSIPGTNTTTVAALPTIFNVTGGGSYCSGGSGVAIGLSGSQAGVNYQLYSGASAVGPSIPGTGSAISFGLQTTAGTNYNVIATNAISSCTQAMTGSVSVIISALPTVYNVTGGGSYCSGGSGVAIGLSGSQTSVNYQLYSGASAVGPSVPGTGSVISFGLQTTAGTNYNVIAANTSTTCTQAMTGSVSVIISALPTVYNVTGGGSYCSGGSGVAIGLSGSQTSVNYQLYSGASAVGPSVPGTGSVISFGLQTTAGTNYNVIAANTSTTCTQNMSGSATVTVNALPTIFNVTGGGSYCSGGSGVAIGLSGSQTGVNYQLYSGASAVGASVPGTGSVISFGLQTTAGTNYNVIATNTTTSCTQNMSGSVSVTVNALPTIFNVTGGGSYCSGGSGVAIGLSGSQTGVNYQLYSGASAVGASVPGTGSAISFGLQTTAGTNYNVIATNTLTTCTQNMSGSVTLTVNALPTIFNVTGGGSYCSGGSGVAIGLSGSQTGVNYQLYSGASAVGPSVPGTGSAISFGLQTTAGTNYNVIATNSITSCTQAMSGSISVIISALPTVYNVTGGGSYCAGGSGVAIGLSGSQTGVNYQLYSGASAVGPSIPGTGSAISFGLQTTAGTSYNVIATNAISSCTQAMTGSVSVIISALPTVYNVTGGGSYCSGGSGVTIGLSGSQAGVNYQLYLGASAVGSAVLGTGSAISFGLQTTAGINYNVIATNATTSCTQAMSGSVTVTVSALPTVYNVTGGGSYCSGGSGVAIGLSGSQAGVNYQLYSGASAVGPSVPGTGSVISFGLQTIAGTSYNVIATNATTSCTQAMTGSVTVAVNPLPGAPLVSTSNPANLCPLKTVDLTTLLTSATPVGGAVLFKTTNNPFGVSITDPTKAGAGIYYIFYQNSSGCYSNSTAVTVTVNNCPPIAYDATNATIPSTAGATAISSLTATDSDGTISGYTVLSLPLHGTLFMSGTAVTAGQILTPIQVASLSYDPNGTFIGNDSFTFAATDNNAGVSNTATFTIPIGNNPPIANSLTNATIPSTSGATAITALTATDTDGTIVSFTVLSLPAHGTLSVGGTAASAGQVLTLAQVNTLTYDPSGTYTGNDTFTYTATDNSGATDPSPATVTIPVGNNPPVANNATNTSIPSSAGATAISALTASDTDGTIASYTILTLPTRGTLYVGGVAATTVQVISLSQASTLTYDPNGTFSGNDTFTFTATDNNGGVSSPATISIPVGNNPPVANSATNATIPSTAGATAISALTATDTDGTIISYTVLTLPTRGTLYMGGTAVIAGQVLTTAQATTLTYDPVGTFIGNDTFTFTATDNNNAVSNTATITIPIGNNPPLAISATTATIPSTAGATAISALAATDTDGTIASYTVLTLPSNGTLFVGGVAIIAGQILTPAQVSTLTYDPNGTFTGNDAFTFTATDNSGSSDQSPATITIPVGNNPPVANIFTNASIPSSAGATALSALAASDTDGTIASYTILTLPLRGTLYVGAIAATAVQVLTPLQVATLTYDPGGAFTGNDTFTFIATDNKGAVSSPATITIPVGNNPPVANNATNATILSTAGTTAISALTATDTDGSIASYTVMTLPAHGTLYMSGTAMIVGQSLTQLQALTLTYDPDGTFTGNDTFTFSATDNNNAVSNTATVTIPIGNNRPVASNATNAVILSTAGATAISALTATDTDGTIASYSILTLPSNGTLSAGGVALTAGQILTLIQVTTLTYDPSGTFTGNDTFTFTATDNNGATDLSAATITIPVGNNPPVANSFANTAVSSSAGATAISALTATDTDGVIASFTILTLPARGTLYVGGIAANSLQVISLSQAATLTYDPAGTFTGNDTFTFTATDNNGGVSSPATITIPVTNNPPVANNATNAVIPSTAGATAILALTASDTDGTIAGYTILSLPSNGTLYVGGVAATVSQVLFPLQAATLTYDPSGTFTGNDSFTFTATDNSGATDLSPATITIPVGNNPPVANDAANATMPSTAGATAISGLTASDTDGTIANFTILTLPAHGTLYVGGVAALSGQVITLAQAAALTYDPNGTFIGNDTFMFKAIDNNNASSNAATITIPVGNNPPLANSAINPTIPSTAGATALSALTATDSDGTIISYTILTLPAQGTLFVGGVTATAGQVLTLAQAAILSYDPNGIFTGNDTFTFTATDNSGAADPSAATITIPIGNNIPIANSVTNASMPSTAGATPLLALTGTDTDGSVTGYAILTLPMYGTLSVETVAVTTNQILTPTQAAKLSYDPTGTFTGNDSFTFTAIDNNGGVSAAATITIPVGNNPPVANSATTAFIPSTADATPIAALTAMDSDGTITGYTILTLPAHGTLSVGGSAMTTGQVLAPAQVSTLAYDPDGTFTGNDGFTFTATDNKGGVSIVATITIPVGNNPPVAVAATNVAMVSSAGATALAALKATDTDGTIASYTVLTLPLHGVLATGGTAISTGQILTVAQAATLTYDPDGSFIGNDIFTFSATDNNGGVSAAATITIPVSNNPPVANSATNPTIPSTAGATVLSALTATDTDGTIVSYTILTLTSQGILSVGGNVLTAGDVLTPAQAATITYLPNGVFSGNDSFIFTVTDNSGAIDTTPATITIPVGNNPPVANPDNAVTNEDTPVSFNITGNDADSDGSIAVSTVDLNPEQTGRQTTFAVSGQGTYVVNNSGMVTFTPVENYNGIATPISYTVNDNRGTASNIASISVTITAINDAPVANPDTKTTAEGTAVTLNVTDNDTDVDGTIVVSSVDLNPGISGRQTSFNVSGQGSYSVNNTGQVTFIPVTGFSGIATPVNYTVNDNSGAVSNISSITITVTSLNAAPVPVDDNIETTQNVSVSIGVLNNDSFGINGPSTGSITASAGSMGTTRVDDGGSSNDPTDDKIIYTPNSGYIGSDIFTYTICNSKGLCSTANVRLTIKPLSDIFRVNMRSTKPVMSKDGISFTWSYIITLRNKQTQLIDSIRIVDDLDEVFDLNPKPTFKVTGVTASGNTLIVNDAFDGITEMNLLSDRSYLAAQSSDSIIIEVSVNPEGYSGQLLNTAYVDGLSAVGKIKAAPTDDSTIPGSFDAARTVLPDVDLTIPDGFTPNGDGFNDKFVIVRNNLVKLKLMVYNRWGNLVYSNADYQNNWDGKSPGGNDLPTGTYFLEIFVSEVSTGNVIKHEMRSITLIR